MIDYSKNEYFQKLFENAVKKTSEKEVLQALCDYLCEEEKHEFIGYFCDDNNCFPEDKEEDI